jgi:hypothetical protein
MPCWPVLREMAGHERESEMAHRARLYFTALRPARRLVDHDFSVPDESHDRQLSAVRAEIDSIPGIASDRSRFRAFLNAVGSRVPERVAAAALDVAAHAEARGHYHAAEEYARTALDSARRAGPAIEARALTLLARIARQSAHWGAAAELGRKAAERAIGANDRGAWAHAITELATLCRARGDADAAADLLAAVRRRAAEWKEEALLGDAAEALAVCALAARLPEVAVHEGWFALHRIQDAERRRRLLENIAIGLRALKLFHGAEACYSALLQSALGSAERARTLVGSALSAAEGGRNDPFRERHDAAMHEIAGLPAPQQPPLLLELARGCLLIGDVPRSAGHAQKALELASAADDDVMAARARELAEWARVQKRGGIIAAIRTDAIPAEDTRALADEIAGAARRVIATRGT